MKAFISQNADKRILDSLISKGFDVTPLAPFSALESPVETHTDMLLCTADNLLFIHKDYLFNTNDFDKIIEIDEAISSKYPNDVLLNIAVVGKNVFCNTKYASKTILTHLNENGYTVNHVAQGYAHCSICIVSQCAIITADKGIYNTAHSIGIDALLISEGHISLDPYEYGFIGGATGATNDAVYFCGSLRHHPDGEKMRTFIENHGKSVIELCDAPICDVGGILFK